MRSSPPQPERLPLQTLRRIKIEHEERVTSRSALTFRCRLSPAHELPDLRQARGLVGAYLTERRDGALQVFHRNVFVAGSMVQVGKVVLERRLAMAVAVGGAQGQCSLGQLERLGENARVTLEERQVVEGRSLRW